MNVVGSGGGSPLGLISPRCLLAQTAGALLCDE